MADLVEIFQYWDLSEAVCARSFLEANDIWTLIPNENHSVMMNGMYGVALGAYRIVVREEDAERAKALLREAHFGGHAIDEQSPDYGDADHPPEETSASAVNESRVGIWWWICALGLVIVLLNACSSPPQERPLPGVEKSWTIDTTEDCECLRERLDLDACGLRDKTTAAEVVSPRKGETSGADNSALAGRVLAGLCGDHAEEALWVDENG